MEGYSLYTKFVPTSPWLFDRVGAVAYLGQHVPSGNACPGLVHCAAGLPSGEDVVDATCEVRGAWCPWHAGVRVLVEGVSDCSRAVVPAGGVANGSE